MAYIVNSSQNEFTPSFISRRTKQIYAIAILVAAAMGFLALFEMGHPFLAAWGALALFGCLFISGAATRSDTTASN
jgi:hypothetical protein